MDDQAFDLLTRRVSTLVTRHTGLRALVAGTIAVLGRGTSRLGQARTSG